METHTHLEDLSNEIFVEIFDYLYALDIFTGFTLLNQRITSILHTIPLHIPIPYNYCRRQIDFFSSHLIVHAHQVISLKTYDTIRDYSSVTALLFHQHDFINFESCTLISINPLTKLDNVIHQIKNLNRLASFSIRQPYNKILNHSDRSDLTRIIFMHKSSSLRSITLQYSYDYLNISNYTSVSSNLLSVNLFISGSRSNVSVYSILSILRLCHTVRYLATTIEHKDMFANNNLYIFIQTSSMNDHDLPIVPQMISFDLRIFAVCDSRSITTILRCMPNLSHFYFHLTIRKAMRSFPGELLNGYVGQEILERHLPCLSKSEFGMNIVKRYPKLDLDMVVNSFEYFVTKYSN